METCILCRSNAIEIVDVAPASQLIAAWRRKFDMEVAHEFGDFTVVRRYRCSDCLLEFFDPDLAGSEALYASLQRFDWYYMPQKWEHDVAMEHIPTGSRVLEVGCGEGAFLERLQREKQCDVLGIELNEAAVATAVEQNRPVRAMPLEELCLTRPGEFDVVCHFQVLEHVADPGPFLQQCLTLLKPDGILLIGVPDRESFIRLDERGVLNKPPHHVSHWSTQVFRRMQELYGLRIVQIRREPLALHHLPWFVSLHLRRMMSVPRLQGAIIRLAKFTVVPFLRVTGLYRSFGGHTLFGAFQNTAATEREKSIRNESPPG